MSVSNAVRRDDLAGRAIVITGAGDGLGRAYALDIARHGASVLVNDVDGDAAQAVVDEIRSTGGIAQADVRPIGTAEAGQATIDASIQAFGRVDGLIANAGIFSQGLAWEMSPERAEAILRVNLLGVLHNGAAAIRQMRRAGRGAIVTVVSSAMFGIPATSAYGASKAGVLALTLAWAKELEGSGIHVHGLSPLAMTAMMRQDTPGFHSLSQPEDVAPLATFLVSDRAAPFHGKIVRLTANRIHLLKPAEFGPALGERERWDIESIETTLRAANA